METAVCRLDGQDYIPSEVSPKLAQDLIFACPLCSQPVFPVWGKKIKSHFRHFHNADIECDWYYGGTEKTEYQASRTQYLKSHPPILQRMLTQRFYALIFQHTHFPEKGDIVTQHLGNALVTKTKGSRTGLSAIAEYKNLKGFSVVSPKFQQAGYWDLDELAELIRVSLGQSTGALTWEHLIDAELANYRVIRQEKIAAGDAGVVAIAEAVIAAHENVKNRANSKVLQLVIDFLRQKRHLPILKDLIVLSYTNAVFPRNPEMVELAKQSGWIQSQPRIMSVSQFFGELMGLSLIRLLIEIPWIEFAQHYLKDLNPKQIDCILVPSLLIPNIVVHPIRHD